MMRPTVVDSPNSTLTYGLRWRHEDCSLLWFIVHEGSLGGRGRRRKYLTVHEIGRLALLSFRPLLRRVLDFDVLFLRRQCRVSVYNSSHSWSIRLRSECLNSDFCAMMTGPLLFFAFLRIVLF